MNLTFTEGFRSFGRVLRAHPVFFSIFGVLLPVLLIAPSALGLLEHSSRLSNLEWGVILSPRTFFFAARVPEFGLVTKLVLFRELALPLFVLVPCLLRIRFPARGHTPTVWELRRLAILAAPAMLLAVLCRALLKVLLSLLPAGVLYIPVQIVLQLAVEVFFFYFAFFKLNRGEGVRPTFFHTLRTLRFHLPQRLLAHLVFSLPFCVAAAALAYAPLSTIQLLSLFEIPYEIVSVLWLSFVCSLLLSALCVMNAVLCRAFEQTSLS